jgi:plastocyanin
VPTAPPATPPPQPPDASGSGAVGISAFSFAPVEITVAAGSEVVWTNQDPASHTATGDGFDTGAVPPGGSGRARFDAAGRFEYHCTIHPGMTGAVVVT